MGDAFTNARYKRLKVALLLDRAAFRTYPRAVLHGQAKHKKGLKHCISQAARFQ